MGEEKKTATVWIHSLMTKNGDMIPKNVYDFTHTIEANAFVNFVGSNALTVPKGNIICYTVSSMDTEEEIEDE